MSSESTLSSSCTRHYKRSRRSIISSSASDITFTRKKLTDQYKCGCYIIAGFLVLLLLAAGAVYIAFTYFIPEYKGPQTFRGTFKIIDGDAFTSEFADNNNKVFKIKARDYRERLNLLFRKSFVRNGFMGTEILALDGTQDKDLIVHFTITIDPAYTKANAKELEDIILDDIKIEDSLLFKGVKIDNASISVIPNSIIPDKPKLLPTTIAFHAVTETPEPPRQCVPIQLPFCSKMNYKLTSYPNIFKHKNLQDVKNNIIPFRELMDAECYNHTHDFVCGVLQPYCVKEDTLLMPCKSFCKYFMAGCGSRLSDEMRALLDCNQFLEYQGDNCLIEPDCGIRISQNSPTFPKTANPGDWPWHVALFKENVHICDGTLVSSSWVATTSSCFQGQPKAEWVAKLGSVRVSMSHPNEITRRIIGLVKSPVEGSSIAMLKIDQPVVFSEYVRPICLPKRDRDIEENQICNTVGWSRDTEQLKRIEIKVTSMQKCDNISITHMNSMCAEAAYGRENCQEEEFAGSSVMCEDSYTKTWSLVGITNWRIACSRTGLERPRMYDKISPNINWIHSTINSEKDRK